MSQFTFLKNYIFNKEANTEKANSMPEKGLINIVLSFISKI